jgi:hypothetical protein
MKYARIERERRYLLESLPAELPAKRTLEIHEITDDQRFSGGELAQTSEEGLRSLLTAYGIGSDIGR